MRAFWARGSMRRGRLREVIANIAAVEESEIASGTSATAPDPASQVGTSTSNGLGPGQTLFSLCWRRRVIRCGSQLACSMCRCILHRVSFRPSRALGVSCDLLYSRASSLEPFDQLATSRRPATINEFVSYLYRQFGLCACTASRTRKWRT